MYTFPFEIGYVPDSVFIKPLFFEQLTEDVFLTQGALAGLIVSLAFLFWVAFGGWMANITTPKSPVNTSGCAWHLKSTTPAPTTINTAALTEEGDE